MTASEKWQAKFKEENGVSWCTHYYRSLSKTKREKYKRDRREYYHKNSQEIRNKQKEYRDNRTDREKRAIAEYMKRYMREYRKIQRISPATERAKALDDLKRERVMWRKSLKDERERLMAFAERHKDTRIKILKELINQSHEFPEVNILIHRL